MERTHARAFADVSLREPTQPNCMLILATYGGDAAAAFRMIRYLQARYSGGKFILYLPDMCKSAGTLIALAADSLVMSEHAELGPLDVQLQQPDEVGQVQSGLVPIQALKTLEEESFRLFESSFLKLRGRSQLQITTRTAAEIASNLAVGLYSGLYSQLDPLRLGETYRSIEIASMYAERVMSGNVRPETVDSLVSGYPSHSFVIDRKEATRLFVDVQPPSDTLIDLMGLVDDLIIQELHQDQSPLMLNLNEMAQELISDETEVDETESDDGGNDDNKTNGTKIIDAEPFSRKQASENGKNTGGDKTAQTPEEIGPVG